MDNSASMEHDNGFDLDLDLESGTGVIHSNAEISTGPDSDKKLAKTVFVKLCDGLASVDDSLVKTDPLNANKKASSAKKPPRPPRPLSLDAYDQKLIKELAEIAMIKRARIERMKALKQKKNSKISSSSSHGSFLAMVFTIIFFLVILFQGQNSGVTIHGSPHTGQRNGSGLTVAQNQLYISPSDPVSASYKSSTGF